MNIEQQQLKCIIEAALLAAGEPLNLERLTKLFTEAECVEKTDIADALSQIEQDYSSRGIGLQEVASGFCFRVKNDFSEWIARLWEEKPPRYSRAVLETLALIVYRQPITRGEIEEVRGVAVSSYIMKSLLERNWVRVVGHRDVPGKPSLYASTREFLDYFNLKNLAELPPLSELQDIQQIEEKLVAQLELEMSSALAPKSVENEIARNSEGDNEQSIETVDRRTQTEKSVEETDAKEINEVVKV